MRELAILGRAQVRMPASAPTRPRRGRPSAAHTRANDRTRGHEPRHVRHAGSEADSRTGFGARFFAVELHWRRRVEMEALPAAVAVAESNRRPSKLPARRRPSMYWK